MRNFAQRASVRTLHARVHSQLEMQMGILGTLEIQIEILGTLEMQMGTLGTLET